MVGMSAGSLDPLGQHDRSPLLHTEGHDDPDRERKYSYTFRLLCVLSGCLYLLWALLMLLWELAVMGYVAQFPVMNPSLDSLVAALEAGGLHQAAESINNTSIWAQFQFPVKDLNRDYLVPALEAWGLHHAAQFINKTSILPAGRWSLDSGRWEAVDAGRYKLIFDRFCGGLHVEGPGVAQDYLVVGDVPVSSTDSWPTSCVHISEADTVDSMDVDTCAMWCADVFGYRPSWELLSPTCTAFATGNTRQANRICSKVQFTHISRMFKPSRVRFLLAAIYALAGLLIAWCSPLADEKVYHVSDQGEELKPEMQKLDMPLCCFRACSAKHRAFWQLIISIPSVLIDGLLDVSSFLLLFGEGQPYFALGTLFVMACNTYHDPFQANAYRAAAHAWRHGMPTRPWLEHQVREGMGEAPLAGWFALVTFLKAILDPHSADKVPAILLGVSAASSLFMAVPAAHIAKHLLDPDGSQSQVFDYTSQELAKAKVGIAQKYFKSLFIVCLGMIAAWGAQCDKTFFLAASGIVVLQISLQLESQGKAEQVVISMILIGPCLMTIFYGTPLALLQDAMVLHDWSSPSFSASMIMGCVGWMLLVSLPLCQRGHKPDGEHDREQNRKRGQEFLQELFLLLDRLVGDGRLQRQQEASVGDAVPNDSP